MPFHSVQPKKLSDSVVEQIEQLILRGILQPGERLPPEREMAERMAVSRPSLRSAISELQERGLLDSRASSGIYVADVLGSAFSDALIGLFAKHDEAIFDYLQFRRDIEALAAERAADHASDIDLKVIATIFDKMEAAHIRNDPEEEATLDAQFHMAIMEASHNVFMLHMIRSMFDLLRQGVFYNRQSMFQHRPIRTLLLDQHRAINTALQKRDPTAARLAVEAHLDHIHKCLADQKKSDANETIARQRLEHEQSRK